MLNSLNFPANTKGFYREIPQQIEAQRVYEDFSSQIYNFLSTTSYSSISSPFFQLISTRDFEITFEVYIDSLHSSGTSTIFHIRTTPSIKITTTNSLKTPQLLIDGQTAIASNEKIVMAGWNKLQIRRKYGKIALVVNDFSVTSQVSPNADFITNFQFNTNVQTHHVNSSTGAICKIKNLIFKLGTNHHREREIIGGDKRIKQLEISAKDLENLAQYRFRSDINISYPSQNLPFQNVAADKPTPIATNGTIKFNGTNQFLLMPTPLSINLTTQIITIVLDFTLNQQFVFNEIFGFRNPHSPSTISLPKSCIISVWVDYEGVKNVKLTSISTNNTTNLELSLISADTQVIAVEQIGLNNFDGAFGEVQIHTQSSLLAASQRSISLQLQALHTLLRNRWLKLA